MALLDVQALTIRFGGLVAVNKIDFSLEAGSLTGLIGPNGAGKTTCFNMLTGVYAPTSGTVLFDGRDVTGEAPYKINRLGMARTFQNIRLFRSMTVLENLLVSMARKRDYGFLASLVGLFSDKKLEEEAMSILKALGMEKKADLEAGGLPYGDQRKLEIARALATGPKLLLLDEPAAGMNPTETAQLSDLIRQIRENFKVTILLIEHDMSLVMKICERIHVLDYGELIASGVPHEIQSNPRVIEAYLGGGLTAEDAS